VETAPTNVLTTGKVMNIKSIMNSSQLMRLLTRINRFAVVNCSLSPNAETLKLEPYSMKPWEFTARLTVNDEALDSESSGERDRAGTIGTGGVYCIR